MEYNLVLDSDSYKYSHYLQYPPDTTSMFSYLESRGGEYPSTVFFGLQYLLKKYLSEPITSAHVAEAEAFMKAHGEPFNTAGWTRIVKQFGGRLPVKIKAVPEGCIIPTHELLMSMESTDADTFWLVGHLETILLRLWYPITVATLSHWLKRDIFYYLKKTSDDPRSEIDFKLHDFGSRGVSSSESAGIGGAAHLVNFKGSDTVQGVKYANHYYKSEMAGFSIPAAEHSTITSWGKAEECAAYENMLNRFAKPGALVAVVSDSYDLWHAIDALWGQALKKRVQESGATIVIRPDSGDPTRVVLESLRKLEKVFGTTVNSKGYKVLPPCVRVIQGDGVNATSINKILHSITEAGFSASNVAFGMGGALLQQVNRDTQKFAIKCSSITRSGRAVDVFKDPITDKGKRSKRGRLQLLRLDGKYTTTRIGEMPDYEYAGECVSRTVYENGEIKVEDTLEAIRSRANEMFKA